MMGYIKWLQCNKTFPKIIGPYLLSIFFLLTPSLNAAIDDPDEILDHLAAIHATDVFPEDGVIHLKDLSLEGFGRADYRMTIHFALGALVPSHGFGEWDSKDYALIVPFRRIAPRAINFFAQDTAYLGPITLEKNDILLAPSGQEVDAKNQFHVVSYDRKKEGLRKAITRVLKDRNFWQVNMVEGSGSPGDSAYIDAVDINDPKFSQKLRGRFPHLTTISPMWHPLHSLVLKLDFFISAAIGHGRHVKKDSPPSAQLLNMTTVLQNLLDYSTNAIADFEFRDAEKIEINQKLQQARGWLRVVKAVAETLREYGYLLTNVNTYDEMDRLIAVRNDPQRFRNELSSIQRRISREGLQNYKQPIFTDYLLYSQTLELLNFRSYDKFLEFLKSAAKPHGIGIESAENLLKFRFLLNRLQRTDIDDPEIKGLLTAFDDLARQMTPEERELAFKKKISGRYPENRGNGLKFVRQVINGEKERGLWCCSSGAEISFGKLAEEAASLGANSSNSDETLTIVIWG